MFQNAVVAADEFLIRRIGLFHVWKIGDAPPAFVARGLVFEPVPAAVRGILMVARPESTKPLKILILIKINAVGAGVAEDAVQYNADAVRAALLAEFLENLLVAQERVDGEVVRRVVAVVGCRPEDRVQVERGHAQRFQIRDLLADAVQRAAKEIEVGDVAGSIFLIVRELIPIFYISA